MMVETNSVDLFYQFEYELHLQKKGKIPNTSASKLANFADYADLPNHFPPRPLRYQHLLLQDDWFMSGKKNLCDIVAHGSMTSAEMSAFNASIWTSAVPEVYNYVSAISTMVNNRHNMLCLIRERGPCNQGMTVYFDENEAVQAELDRISRLVAKPVHPMSKTGGTKTQTYQRKRSLPDLPDLSKIHVSIPFRRRTSLPYPGHSSEMPSPSTSFQASQINPTVKLKCVQPFHVGPRPFPPTHNHLAANTAEFESTHSMRSSFAPVAAGGEPTQTKPSMCSQETTSMLADARDWLSQVFDLEEQQNTDTEFQPLTTLDWVNSGCADQLDKEIIDYYNSLK